MLYKSLVGETRSSYRAILVLLVLLLPTALFLNNALIWDDTQVFESHVAWSRHALLGPYLASIGDLPYWRPLTVLTIALPELAGVPIWFNKLISLGLYFVQGWLAIKIADEWLKHNQIASDSLPLIVLALLMALHPIFVEPAMWLSARADLLMGVVVLLGVLWLYKFYAQQEATQSAKTPFDGLWRGFLLTWLICGAKDSGIVWAALAWLVVASFSFRSTNGWRRYWQSWVAGISVATASYLLARFVLFGQGAVLSGINAPKSPSASEWLHRFTEFVVRALIDTLLPILDPAPFKSSGWLDTYSNATLAAILLAILGAMIALILHMQRRNKFAACLTGSALILIIFYAAQEAHLELTFGSILACRYLAPGNALILIVLATALYKPVPINTNAPLTPISIPVAALVALVLLQSMSMWGEARASWSSNFDLWENSWRHGSESKLVAEGYVAGYASRGDYVTARRLANYWIAKNPQAEMTTKPCQLYEKILEFDVILHDQNDGVSTALRALPIGWCHPTLTRNITHYLIHDHCTAVTPMIYRAIETGNQPRGTSLWQFKDQSQRNQFVLLAVYAEVRCGDLQRAVELLKAVSVTDPTWEAEGSKAQTFINSARATN